MFEIKTLSPVCETDNTLLYTILGTTITPLIILQYTCNQLKLMHLDREAAATCHMLHSHI